MTHPAPVKLRAVFGPDGADVSTADTIRTVGPHPVMIPAVWVPEGGAPPCYPYEHIGQAVFIPDSNDRDTSVPCAPCQRHSLWNPSLSDGERGPMWT